MRFTNRRGKKGILHTDPADPPRQRGNKKTGHGTWDNDRIPVLGIVARDTGRLRLAVLLSSRRAEIEPYMLASVPAGATVYTDDWHAYGKLAEQGRPHATVCHDTRRAGGPEYARDDDGDGDGIREVHCNTLEGIWTGFRNYLRPFRGVGKWYLDTYVAMFQWSYSRSNDLRGMLRAMLNVHCTGYGT
jgi:transposase-like protein